MTKRTHFIAGIALAATLMCTHGEASAKSGQSEDVTVCTHIRAEIRTNTRNGSAWHAIGQDDVLLHLAGCEVVDGSVTKARYSGEGISGGGCNLAAYRQAKRLTAKGINLADDDGYWFGYIFDRVTAHGHCVGFEDGTYMRR